MWNDVCGVMVWSDEYLMSIHVYYVRSLMQQTPHGKEGRPLLNIAL